MYELLIVDDEQYVLDSLAGTYPWEELGIGSVHTASSATDALKILDMHTIDIVISDIRMPGLSGLELVEKIRTTSPKTKCVLLSGYSEFQYAKRAIDSDVEAYLLKPVKEQELMETIGRIVDQIRTEWEEIVSRQRIQYSFNEHLPMLRDMLLNELLRGKPFSANALAKKLDTLQLSLREQEPFTLMVARMERGFEKYDEHDRSLLEFGITNICEEIFAPRFNLWKCKDIYGHLVFVITRRKDVTVENESERDIRKLQEKFAVQLQDNVEKYLHGSISIIISNKGKFPDDLYAFYQKAVSLFRSRTEPSETFFIRTVSTGEPDELQPLRKIQEPPTLTHLLEAGRWEDAEKKLEQIVREVKERKAHVPQLLLEIALMLRFSACASCTGSRCRPRTCRS